MNQAKQAIIVYTREPEADHGDSQLRPYLDEEELKGLHEAFLRDIAATIEDALCDVLIAYETEDGEVLPEDAKLRAIFPEATFYPQQGDTLGESLYYALTEGFNWGYARCLLIDTNVPYAKKEDYNRAFDILTRKDYVLGPTEVGKLWLIGAKADPDPLPLKTILTLEHLENENMIEDLVRLIPSWKSYELLEEKYDIDNIGDLLLHRDVAEGFTADYLKGHHVLTVIVPVYNEEASIDDFLLELEKIGNRTEVIFVDGGSTDATKDHLLAACRQHRTYRLVRSIRNRATQMNAGAEAANGDVLLFLNSDMTIGTRTIGEILRVIDREGAGYFPIQYQSGGFFLWIEKLLLNHRAKKGFIAGEQALFVTRDRFYDSGMIPEVSCMEDYLFAGELRKTGGIGVAGEVMLVSNRKYQSDPSRQSRDARALGRLRKRFIGGESIETLEQEFDALFRQSYPMLTDGNQE